MLNYFAFSYNISGIKFMLVNYIVFIYDIVLMSYYMLVPNYALCTWAVKNLSYDRFVTASLATIHAVTIHVFISFAILMIVFVFLKGFRKTKADILVLAI